jgi:nicotinate dehydrogenase subunit B
MTGRRETPHLPVFWILRDRETGKIVARHIYGALDAGLAGNPARIENQISGMLVQAASRMLKEEITFNRTNVTSLDWNSYPILRFEECPEVTPVVIQRLDQASSGAGEEVLGLAAAAIANAFFDATGVRLREYPLTPARVLSALRVAAPTQASGESPRICFSTAGCSSSMPGRAL